MTFFRLYLYFYAFLLLSGAYFGLKVGSKISLVMGLVSGCLVLVGLLSLNYAPQLGQGLIMCLSGLLSFVFIKRLLATGKFMPAGLLLVASMLALYASFGLS